MTELTDREYEKIFDPMDEVAHRWDITLEEAELFLEDCGYFEAIGGGEIPPEPNSDAEGFDR